MVRWSEFSGAAVLLLLGFSLWPSSALAERFELVSAIDDTPPTSRAANSTSTDASLSADGRYIAFTSLASNLVANDSLGSLQDVFRYDTLTHQTLMVTRDSNFGSEHPSISADGRYIAFDSAASNLVEGDVNQRRDIFVYDVQSDSFVRLTAGSDNSSRVPVISADGRYVAFESRASNLASSDTNGSAEDVFLFDTQTGSTVHVSAGGNGPSLSPAISADGRYVAFSSQATNLAAGDSNGAIDDIFVYEVSSGSMTLVTPGADGPSAAPAISGDGRFVAFHSSASNIDAADTNGAVRDIFRHDTRSGQTLVLTPGGNGSSIRPAISSDGNRVAFQSVARNLAGPDPFGLSRDVFVRDVQAGSTVSVTAGGDGDSEFAAISADGRIAAFSSDAKNLVVQDDNGSTIDVFHHELSSSTTILASPALEFEIAGGDGDSGNARVSDDGRFVVFESFATNLTAAGSTRSTGIFVRDLIAQTTSEVTSGADGGPSSRPAISGDGRFVAFVSRASNLVPSDPNGNNEDVFIHDRQTQDTRLITPGSNGSTSHLSISANGRFVAFDSTATNLVANDTNGVVRDVFVYDAATEVTVLVTPGGNSDSDAPSISADGRYVAFASRANNLVPDDPTSFPKDIFLYDMELGTTRLLTRGGDGDSTDPEISADARFVAFASRAENLVDLDPRMVQDIFSYEVSTGEITLVTFDGLGPSSMPSISANGRYIAFQSEAGNLLGLDRAFSPSNVYLYDSQTRIITWITEGADQASFAPSISGDGQAVAFETRATNLANDGTTTQDVFLFRRDGSLQADWRRLSTLEDVDLPITLTANNPRGGNLDYRILEGPDNGVLTGLAPNLVYRPEANFNGKDRFRFEVADGVATSRPAVVTIEVDPVNDAPVAMSFSETLAEDTNARVFLRASDPDQGVLNFRVVELPANGQLFFSFPAVTYVPNPDFNGTDRFTYTVSDGVFESAPAAVSLVVTPVNDPPTADAQSLRTGANLPIPVRLTGSDVDGDMLTFRVANQPASGSLEGLAPDLLYVPDPAFSGRDQFSIIANDGAEDSVEALIEVLVISGNTAPVADAQSLATTQDQSLPVLLSGTDADGDILSFTVESLPSNGALLGQAPALTYRPDAGYVGSDSFSFSVQDGVTSSAPALVQISVSAGGVEAFCGEPGLDRVADRGVFLWQDCSRGRWFLRFAAGESAELQKASGVLFSDSAVFDIRAISVEADDALESTLPERISYRFSVVGMGIDGFNFVVGAGSGPVCFVPAVDGPTVFLGAGRRVLAEPGVDLRSGQPCVPPPDSDGDGLPDTQEAQLGTDPFEADTDGGGVQDGDEVANGTDPLDGADDLILACGQPNFDPGVDAGFFIGLDCAYDGPGQRYRLTVTGGGRAYRRYLGSLAADGPVVVEGDRLESRDRVGGDLDEGLLTFDLGVSLSGVDSLLITVPERAASCFAPRASRLPVLVGAAGLRFDGPVDLSSLRSCQ